MCVVECLRRLFHRCQGGVRDDGFLQDIDAHFPDAADYAHPRICQDQMYRAMAMTLGLPRT